MPTAIVPSSFSVEWRDKSGNLKGYLTPYLSKKPTWDWNRKGGCGACSLMLKKGYRDLDFAPRDDIRIRLDSGSTTKLVYRGYLSKVTSTLSQDSSIALQVNGYFDLLKKIVVQDAGDTKIYYSQSISDLVDDIIDTYVVTKSSITKGTIDASAFSVDHINFLDTVESCLSTLADLLGNVEYGVDEDLVFFWRTESTTEAHRFFVGVDVKMLERAVNSEDIINKIYLKGDVQAHGGKHR
jgi:hypothetical protein